MQNPVVVIGGLEKSYMQKLALYLNTRIGKDGYVELLEGSDRQMDLLGSSGKQMELLESSGRQIDSVREDMRLQNVRHQREKHWELAVGSEAFVVALQEAGQAEQILILTDTEEEDETHISQYQARSVLFQKIIARYQSIASVGMQMAAVKKGYDYSILPPELRYSKEEAEELLPPEEELIESYLRAKVRTPPTDDRERKRLSDSLARRGFSWPAVRTVLRRFGADWADDP